MFRLKQSMGNVIKGKLDSEDMISKYECSILEDNRLNSLFHMQVEKKSAIVYCDDVKSKLADVMESNVDEKYIESYLGQIARVILDINKMGLNPEKLVLNPEWIYLSRDEKTLKFIYCPVNGMGNRYDGILFMKDLLLSAPLSKNVRDRWKQWLDSVTKTGITEQAIAKLESGKEIKSDVQHNASIFDEYGEALTGPEEGIWQSYSPDAVSDWKVKQSSVEYEEAMTGLEDDESGWHGRMSNDYGESYINRTSVSNDNRNFQNYYDEDGEAPTGVEDCAIPEKHSFKEAVSNSPSLVRVNTGERVVISGDNFKLGRSEQRADFCIKNNSGISNVHATVIRKNGQYFLKDNYSTNGTYVNGNKISDSSVPILLRDGSVIQLYNEEIVFYC